MKQELMEIAKEITRQLEKLTEALGECTDSDEAEDYDCHPDDYEIGLAITQYVGSGVTAAIPQKINFQPVVAIAGELSSNTLKCIAIPDTVTSIDPFAVSRCDALERIRVDNGSSDFCDVDGVLMEKCQTMPFSGKHILRAYPKSKKANVYKVPDSVVEIAENAFMWSSNLGQLLIHENVHYIEEGAIYGCEKLREVRVDKNNPCYASVGGVLFNKEMTVLLAYPSGKTDTSYKIPCGVRRIGKGAFASCSNLKNLIVPDTVASIGEWVGEDTHFQVRRQLRA